MAARIPMIATTIINSISVKPFWPPRPRRVYQNLVISCAPLYQRSRRIDRTRVHGGCQAHRWSHHKDSGDLEWSPTPEVCHLRTSSDEACHLGGTTSGPFASTHARRRLGVLCTARYWSSLLRCGGTDS